MSALEYDYLIIGSGFGGSVSALRLLEKGYKVLMLEKGSELDAADFPESNWSLRRWLWAPALGWRGLFQIRPFSHVFVLAGAGVGGGSLTYANTLPLPKPAFFRSGSWASLCDWEQELAPHYQTARAMLGAAQTDFLAPGDRVLFELAKGRGASAAFHKPHVAVFMGPPGQTVADPYFGGRGPARTGCVRCGACMTGCRVGAKNSLDKNYLHLARQLGLELHADSEVVDVVPRESGGYDVDARVGRRYYWRAKRRFSARSVIFAAGALGTNSLLLRLRHKGSLRRLSPELGRGVRTNSEALIFVTVPGTTQDFSTGVAINSLLDTGGGSHLEVVRYARGSGFFRLIAAPHVGAAGGFWLRLLRLFLYVLLHPYQVLRAWLVLDWAKSTLILLYMRSSEGRLRFQRSWVGVMNTALDAGEPPEAAMPEATELARAIAAQTGGVVMSPVHEALLGVPTTAHIIGGCCIGESAATGVIDARHRVFGHEGLLVIDGSALSANPGVNPALTITALAERAMAAIPRRADLDAREGAPATAQAALEPPSRHATPALASAACAARSRVALGATEDA
jgi:cholesterol oxidase